MSFLIGVSLLWQEAQPTPQSIKDVFITLQSRAIKAIPGLFTGALVLLFFLLLAWVGGRIIAYAAPRVKADTGVVLLLSRVYYYGVIIFGIITALATAGMNVSALIAGLGLTGFVLGFALKDVLSNLVSGIMLLLYRPFSVGDQITMGNYEGTITNIRMRDTLVRSFDGRCTIIPNSLMITQVVINNDTSQLVRQSVIVSVPANMSFKEARDLILRAMEKTPAIAGRVETPILLESDQDTMRLEGRFWFNPRQARRATVKREIAQAVTLAFEDTEIELNFLTEQGIEERPDDKEFVLNGKGEEG